MSLSLYTIPGCHVDRARQEDGQLLLVVRAKTAGASCPACRRRSTAPHSTYVRHPADLPALGQGVRLELHVRRFYCRHAQCARRTFAERLQGLIDPRAQRTRRLASAQRRVAVQAGGEAGERLLTYLAMPTSADTPLRLVRRAPAAAPAGSQSPRRGRLGPAAWTYLRHHPRRSRGPPHRRSPARPQRGYLRGMARRALEC